MHDPHSLDPIRPSTLRRIRQTQRIADRVSIWLGCFGYAYFATEFIEAAFR